jgi:ABC-2 type transport system permease protein
MNMFRAAFGTEILKTRRSRVPWGVGAAFTLMPFVIGMFMLIIRNPDAARALGLLGAKAQLTAGSADWPTFLSMLGQALTIGSAILFAFLTAWVFGREFADRTIRGLLAVPTPRRVIVLAKAAVIATWGSLIAAWVVALGLVIGAMLDLPDWSAPHAANAVGGMAVGAVLTIALQSYTAFFAGVGRGYIAPLAWAVATVVAAQLLAVLGWGAWFPWSVPAILAGAGGAAVDPVGAAAIAVVVIVALLGLVATVAWWDRADQTG